MIINPNVEIVLLKHIQNHLDQFGKCKIKEIFQNYDAVIPVTKAELINTINNSIRTGNLCITDKKVPWQDSTVTLVKPFQFPDKYEEISIVISKPRFVELSLGNIEQRNKQIDSLECFREIISSAKDVLRICSPFMQKNVLEEASFPDLRELLVDALKNDVEIRLLSRELFQGRAEEIQWIIDIATKLGKIANLKVVDYHLSLENRSIISSTHAKLIVADYDMAYVGSAELRQNSLIANFEVGCLVKGPQVFGICEVFDFMFSHGRPLK